MILQIPLRSTLVSKINVQQNKRAEVLNMQIFCTDVTVIFHAEVLNMQIFCTDVTVIFHAKPLFMELFQKELCN